MYKCIKMNNSCNKCHKKAQRDIGVETDFDLAYERANNIVNNYKKIQTYWESVEKQNSWLIGALFGLSTITTICIYKLRYG